MKNKNAIKINERFVWYWVLVIEQNITYFWRGKGQNVKNQNVESQKERWKFEKDQNVESIFKIDQNVKSDINRSWSERWKWQ
jgi:hypothetical protein